MRVTRTQPDRLAVTPAYHRALVAAERPDAVAGAEEREVGRNHGVEQPAQVRLDPALHRRFLLRAIGVVERPAAHHYPRPFPQVDISQRVLLQPEAPQVAFLKPGQAQEGLVLVIGRGIIGPDGQQQDRIHPITLVSTGNQWSLSN